MEPSGQSFKKGYAKRKKSFSSKTTRKKKISCKVSHILKWTLPNTETRVLIFLMGFDLLIYRITRKIEEMIQ